MPPSNRIVRWWLFPEFGAELQLYSCTPTVILNNPIFYNFINVTPRLLCWQLQNFVQVFILLSELHTYIDLYNDFYSDLLHVSAVYFSHHQTGVLVHTENKNRDFSLPSLGGYFWIPSKGRPGAETCRNFMCYILFLVVLCAFVGYCNYNHHCLIAVATYEYANRFQPQIRLRRATWVKRGAACRHVVQTEGHSITNIITIHHRPDAVIASRAQHCCRIPTAAHSTASYPVLLQKTFTSEKGIFWCWRLGHMSSHAGSFSPHFLIRYAQWRDLCVAMCGPHYWTAFQSSTIVQVCSGFWSLPPCCMERCVTLRFSGAWRNSCNRVRLAHCNATGELNLKFIFIRCTL